VCAGVRVAHGDLPSDPLVEQMVLTELGAGPPVRLGPSDCAALTAAASSR
jgi:hypothetical protein